MTFRGGGDMDRRVALDAPLDQPDGSGGIETDWQHRFDAWAAVRWLRGGETVQAARLSGRQPGVFRLNANPTTRTITTDWRLRDLRTIREDASGRVIAGIFAIRQVVETEDRAWIEITAETGVAV